MRFEPQITPSKTPGCANTFLFKAAMRLAVWLVDQVQVHASVLADGRPVLTASPPSGEVWRSYYYAGGQRIAMRVQDGSGDEVFYLLGDHLGSTTVTADGEGVFHSETRYGPWGEVLAQSGAMPSGYTYTGQFSYAEDFGLLYYVARFYDPYRNRCSEGDMVGWGLCATDFRIRNRRINSRLEFL